MRFDGTVIGNLDCSDLFYGLEKCTSIDLTGFVTEVVGRMDNMFFNCTSLKTLDLSGFDLANLSESDSVSTVGNAALEKLWAPVNLTQEFRLPHTMTDAQGNEYTQLPLNLSESILLTKAGTKAVTFKIRVK